MKAQWNNATLADSDETIVIEGNHYFPASSVKNQYLSDSDTVTTCIWKGVATYYNINVDGQINQDAAFSYNDPNSMAIDRVKKDFTGYVAFWRGVKVSQSFQFQQARSLDQPGYLALQNYLSFEQTAQ